MISASLLASHGPAPMEDGGSPHFQAAGSLAEPDIVDRGSPGQAHDEVPPSEPPRAPIKELDRASARASLDAGIGEGTAVPQILSAPVEGTS